MKMNKICGIYKITSPTGKIYIGQSRNIKKRIETYRNYRCKAQRKLYASLTKHGWNAHMCEIIHECDESKLNDLEKFYIKEYNTFNTEHGLNLTSGGDYIKLSEETKKKISDSHIGNNYCLGRKISDTTKRKISESNKGRACSEERKLSISLQHKGNKYNLGRKTSEETKEKLRTINKNKIMSDATKRKISESNKGKVFTNEAKLKMSMSKKNAPIRNIEKMRKINQGHYEIYNNDNILIYKFNNTLKTELINLNLDVNKFISSLRWNNKIRTGTFTGWYIIKLPRK